MARDRISDEIERISVALPPAKHLHAADIWAEANGVEKGSANIDAFMTRRGHQLKWLIQTYRDGEAEALLELLRAEFWGMEPGEWPDVESAAAGALRPGKEPK